MWSQQFCVKSVDFCRKKNKTKDVRFYRNRFPKKGHCTVGHLCSTDLTRWSVIVLFYKWYCWDQRAITFSFFFWLNGASLRWTLASGFSMPMLLSHAKLKWIESDRNQEASTMPYLYYILLSYIGREMLDVHHRFWCLFFSKARVIALGGVRHFKFDISIFFSFENSYGAFRWCSADKSKHSCSGNIHFFEIFSL